MPIADQACLPPYEVIQPANLYCSPPQTYPRTGGRMRARRLKDIPGLRRFPQAFVCATAQEYFSRIYSCIWAFNLRRSVSLPFFFPMFRYQGSWQQSASA